MPIYKGTTELTKIADFLTATEHDITEVYFGDKQVFTVWGEYDGALPAQYSANGSASADYRVYGSAGGVGDRTENLFEVESDMLSSLNWALNPPFGTSAHVYFINYKLSDAVTQELKKGIHTCSIFEHFTDGYTPNLLVCAFVPTLTSTVEDTYRILINQGVTSIKTFDFSEWQDIYIVIGYGNGFNTEAEKQSKIDELFGNWKISIVEGSTAPAAYVPYGYKINMSVSNGTTSTTATSIYIGDESLGEDEYVDYKEQKVYRRTENLFNKANADIGSIYIGGPTIGDDYPSTAAIRSDYIYVTPGGTYYVKVYDGFYFQYCAGYNGTRFAYAVVSNTPPLPSGQKITIPANVNKIRVIFRKSRVTPYPEVESTDMVNATITEGSTAPEQYIPYLQPEDPPVPFPALPTVDGTTVIDYAGQSAARPNEFFAKYRKQNF